jgi:hypothetical protein
VTGKHPLWPENGDGSFVTFWKRVGIVCIGMSAAITLATMIGAWSWRAAMRPVIAMVQAESAARVVSDSVMTLKLNAMADAMRYPLGSRARERAIRRSRGERPARD